MNQTLMDVLIRRLNWRWIGHISRRATTPMLSMSCRGSIIPGWPRSGWSETYMAQSWGGWVQASQEGLDTSEVQKLPAQKLRFLFVPNLRTSQIDCKNRSNQFKGAHISLSLSWRDFRLKGKKNFLWYNFYGKLNFRKLIKLRDKI